MVIDGITIIDPGQYCIQAYGGRLTTTNVKCFGWWYETDGWVGGNDSKLSDSFFKVNDDVVKLYFKRYDIRDLVIYHQFNGAPFQFGWGGETGGDGLIENIDIIAEEVTNLGKNRALFNTAQGNASNSVKNFTFNDIRVDRDIAAIIGINSSGTYDNIKVNRLSINGVQKNGSYINGGKISNIRFDSLTIGGKLVQYANEIGLTTSGNVTGIIFNSAPVVPPAAPTNLTVRKTAPGKFTLTWDDNSFTEDQFVVDRSTDNTKWTEIGRSGINNYRYYDNLTDKTKIYFYRVKALNIAGSSSYSNIASAKFHSDVLPSGWKTESIGASSLVSDVYQVKDTFNVLGTGKGLFENEDNCLFVYKV